MHTCTARDRIDLQAAIGIGPINDPLADRPDRRSDLDPVRDRPNLGTGRNFNNNDEILIKREPLVYTRARRAVQRKKKEREKEKG